MEFTLRFRVPAFLLKGRNDSNDGNSIDSRSSAATGLAAECGEGGSAATVQHPAASHVDYPITVDPQEPLQSAFDKLFLFHLPHCCLPGQQTRQQHDDAENAGVQEEGKGSNRSDEKQAVRFMAIGQVVYLSPAVPAVKARLKTGTVIKVLAVKSKEVNRENSAQISAGNSSGISGTNNDVVGEKATAEGEEKSPVVTDHPHPPLAAPQDSALISAPVSAPPPVSTALVSAYALASAYAFISRVRIRLRLRTCLRLHSC
ncbi:unnamed protein product [Closterium sp. NIES-65]|nr:unnamed protein product [Closterium sp. NIES-65]